MQKLPRLARELLVRALQPIPAQVRSRYRAIGADGEREIAASLLRNYHTGWRSPSNYRAEDYQADVVAHLGRRLAGDRTNIIPWIHAATPLQSKRVLEIGCGTGSSTVALAEQGANVVAMDVDDGAVAVAKDRIRTYGLEAEFVLANAESLRTEFEPASFDLVIFFACLEHMTVGERIGALRDAWTLLPEGGLLVVVETPNRLWYFDDHTSMLPFFHWLPDDLAFQYSRFSPRENFRELYVEYTDAQREHFLRRGRGVSFHEFDVAIGDARELEVISSLSSFQGLRHRVRLGRTGRKYKSLLHRVHPALHQGFFDDHLDLIIRKAGRSGASAGTA